LILTATSVDDDKSTFAKSKEEKTKNLDTAFVISKAVKKAMNLSNLNRFM